MTAAVGGSADRLRVTIVGQGLDGLGGVPSVARWLVNQLRQDPDFEVQVVELATSARDTNSRRLLRPATWLKRSLRGSDAPDGMLRWGANLPELEAARYLPRRGLTALLSSAHVVHVVSGGPAVGRACLSAGRPVVLQVATMSAWERESLTGARRGMHVLNRPLVASFERQALRGAATVLVMNKNMAAFVRGIGQPKVRIAPPGVDCQLFSPSPSGWESRGPLLSVCRLSDDRKGLVRMVRAYERLASVLGAATPELILAGAGPVPDKLSEELQRLGQPGRIRVLTDVAQTELPALYRSASCFVQTSFEEGLGLSSIEAMACGIPVVSSATDGSREVVDHGRTGRLVEENADNFEARFADAVRTVLDGEGRAMSSAARERAVVRFSNQATFAAVREIYRDAATGS